MIAELPARCLWCGAVLMGGATVHRPECWLSPLTLWPELPAPLRAELKHKFATGQWRIGDECTCRTAGCGHRASSHIGGTCFECGREGCWR